MTTSSPFRRFSGGCGPPRPDLSRMVSWGTVAAVVLVAAVLMAFRVETTWAGAVIALGCHLPVLLGAWALTQRVPPAAPCRLLLAAYVYFSALIGLGLLLGQVGLLTPGIALFAAALLGAVMCWIGHTAQPSTVRREDRSPRATATLVETALIILVALVAWRSLGAPTYDFDVLTYHLMFPARWIQDGTISIIPTWCGDPAPSYAPLASEVYYTWLFLPMGEDTLARCGQFPFWLLLLIAGQGLAGELRLGPTAQRCVAIIVVLVPSITAQAGTAMVDVALAAHLVSVTCFSLRIVRWPPRMDRPETGDPMSNRVADVIGLVLAAGLCLGTKYIALAYVAAFLPLLAWSTWRSLAHGRSLLRRPAVLSAMLVAFWIGGFWYVRNAVVTGNPVYPVEVRIGASVLCEGAYGRAQMENSTFNVRRQNPADAFGRTVWFAWNAPGVPIPAADEITGQAAVFRHWYLGPLGFVVGLFLLAAVMRIVFLLRRSAAGRVREISEVLFYLCVPAACAVFWYLLPFQQPRFGFGLIALGIVGASGAVRLHRRAGPFLLTFVIVFCWPTIRDGLQALFTDVPWFVWLFVLVCLSLPCLARRFGVVRVAGTPIGAALAFCLVVAAAGLSADSRSRTFSSGRWQFLGPAWDWIDRELHNVTIAYVGNNVPYFLCGRRLENRVVYVPARRPAQGRFDEYVVPPEAVRLGAPNTSEPVVDRYVMDGNIWLENLRKLDVDYVLVSQMFPGLLLNMRHDSQGFPIEEQWLDQLCRTTWPEGTGTGGGVELPVCAERREFAGGAVRLYRFHHPPEGGQGLSLSRIVRDETDALARLQQDQTPRGRPIRDYPLARPMIERYGLAPITRAGLHDRQD